jgi:hypothetical protein
MTSKIFSIYRIGDERDDMIAGVWPLSQVMMIKAIETHQRKQKQQKIA